MVIAATTEDFKELLSWVWSLFGARFHGRVIPYGYRTDPGAAFGMSRTLGAISGEEDAAELLRLLIPQGTGKNKAQEPTKK